MTTLLSDKLRTLPDAPGIYQFKHADGTVLYIGKAKSLRHRVRSYFQPSRPLDAKTDRLMQQVTDFELVVTANEIESLILEANLVRQHKPRYNVRLKDDKHFPYVKVTTNEPFPRVLVVRRLARDGATYFGPFTSSASMWKSIKLLTRLFRIRTCNLVIPHPEGKPYKVCLDYHIKRCGGPCEGYQSEQEYAELVKSVLLALSGKSKELLSRLDHQMQAASAELRFEEARMVRDQIRSLEAVAVKQATDVGEVVDRDVIAIAREGTLAVAVVLQIRQGALLGRQDFQLAAEADTSDEEVLEAFLEQYYHHQPNLPDELFIPLELANARLIEAWLRQVRGGTIRLATPKIGDKTRLIDLASRNARLLIDELLIQKKMTSERTSKMVTDLKDKLRLPLSPIRIACFDISNTGETDVVGSCAFFENAKPKKSDYRHFKIKGVAGQDDFAMMREIVGRYFFRLREEEKQPPDLIVIDGGKGQLGAAIAELQSLGFSDQPVISLAKRLEEVYLPGLSEPLSLPKASPALMLLKRIRDEAHRFAITYNRAVRKKRTIKSALDEIKGIGPAKRDALLRHFGSVEKIKGANIEELTQVKGIHHKAAELIASHFSGRTAPEVVD